MPENFNSRRVLLAILAVIAFVAVNAGFSNLAGWRLDLTENRLFTLSDGSKNILTQLDQPVELTFYYSSNLGREVPAYGSYADRVRDMLSEFSAASGGKLRYREVDPLPFSEQEDEAVEAGMQGVPLDASGEKVYLGLTGRIVGAEETDRSAPAIPFFQTQRERFLEYDLSKLVYSLSHPELPVVGVVTGAQVFGDYGMMMQGREPQPWAAIAQAQEFFTVEQLFTPEDFLEYQPEILMVIHPRELGDEMLYAIDQFMMRGGRAVMFLDPWYETAAGGRPGMVPENSETALTKLFDKWGISIEAGKFAGDIKIGREVNAGENGQVIPAPYAAWLMPKDENFNRDEAAIADLQQMLIPSAGIIRQAENSPLTMIPLIVTSDQARALDVADLRQPKVLDLLKNWRDTPEGSEQFTLAARFSGPLATAFPDGPPEPEKDEAATEETGDEGATEETTENASDEDTTAEEEKPKFLPHLEVTEKTANIILVADADLLVDRFWVQVSEFFGQRMMIPFGDNGSLLVNALENMSGSTDLISLRSRGTGQRPFTMMADIRRAAEERYREQEQQLSKQLIETEQKIAELQGGGADGQQAVIESTPETEATIQQFTEDLLATRKELRAVNHKLRQDIEQLEGRVKFVNIAAVPLIVALAAFALGWARRQQRRRVR
ncbi:GldG family protein [Aestuariispira insulae]|uniref:ABC-type uncharacterized transport system involved in gliding motility auxiliary subunit n=1 Tax=Aestuariispira insulae TaxID=1461337 RepID=A0A3D9H6G5_9PROT|nr:GldG family protein [Aestuariispira insulae]RED45103.1 ABC-type uncharacterized transport system involved in gliding motility auxiliary subunit [Aestuariispira insulae]